MWVRVARCGQRLSISPGKMTVFPTVVVGLLLVVEVEMIMIWSGGGGVLMEGVVLRFFLSRFLPHFLFPLKSKLSLAAYRCLELGFFFLYLELGFFMLISILTLV